MLTTDLMTPLVEVQSDFLWSLSFLISYFSQNEYKSLAGQNAISNRKAFNSIRIHYDSLIGTIPDAGG